PPGTSPCGSLCRWPARPSPAHRTPSRAFRPARHLGENRPVTDAPPVSPADLDVLAEQLGRPPRGVVGIAARCVCGRPLVVRTAPRLEDGTPFPTTFYLTEPAVVRAVCTLEAEWVMKEMT